MVNVAFHDQGDKDGFLVMDCGGAISDYYMKHLCRFPAKCNRAVCFKFGEFEAGRSSANDFMNCLS